VKTGMVDPSTLDTERPWNCLGIPPEDFFETLHDIRRHETFNPV
jgi:hypothetical protein